jgi:PKD repeat protein
VFSWSATEYPISWSVTLLEQNGAAGPVTGGGHQGTFSRPSLNPTASFTYAQTSTPGEFVFTSTSLQGSGPLEERWYSPDDHSQSPAPQRTWTHTFPTPGTYTINLEVSDAGPGSASATAEVIWDGSRPSPPSTTLTIATALKPTADPGRFKVTLDGQTVFPAAGNGDNKQLVVEPGPHVIGELGVSGTNLFKYSVSMTCTNGPSTVTTKGTVYVLQVSRGTHTDCTITNKATKQLHCVVPDLTGKKLTKAAKALRKAHCAVGSLSPKHPSEKAKVTSFSPTVGSVRPEGTEVKLTFG